MSFRVSVILGALLVVLLAFVFVYERPRMEAERAAADAKKASVIDVERQSVSKLTLVNKFGRFAAEKRGNDWMLVEPVETPGNWAEFEDMVVSARSVARGRVVVDSSAYVGGTMDLAGFGLDPPRVEVRFVSQAGEDLWLFFGDDNPAGRAAYFSWSGGNKVVLTHRYQRDRFELSLMDLRDKRILPFDPDVIAEIKIETPEHVVAARRSGFSWELLAPIKSRADAPTVNGVLAELKSGQFVDVVAESFGDASRYGLDAPPYRVVLTERDTSKRHMLLLGKEVPDSRQSLRYGHYASRPCVFAIEPFLLEKVFRMPPDAFRYRQVFEFDRKGIDRIELAYVDSSVVCEKRADGAWSVVQPEGRTVGGADVENWIDRVNNLRAESFERDLNSGHFGLDRPFMTASLWRGGERVREVRIGQHDRRWFAWQPDSQEVVGVSSDVPRGLELNLKDESESQSLEAGSGT